MTENRSFV